jgi:glycosyltransferase involved in cell wall biosynthesis
MPANAVRGIGRWTNELTLALTRHASDLLAAVSVDPTLPLPAVVNRLPSDVPILTSNEMPRVGEGERLVFHIVSAMEDLELDRLWPRWAQAPAVGLLVTVHDMIPALFPNQYFPGSLKYRLESRYRLVRQADAVIAVSHTTARDTFQLLELEWERIFIVYGSVGSQFSPHPRGRAGAYQELEPTLKVEPEFLLSIGNVDPRKNLSRLLRAYATLPASLRQRHPLVITCSQGDSNDLAILRMSAFDLGVSDDVLFTGFVDDPTMIRLLQACHAMVYPSLYEGLGLPVVEAMRCGAATIASDIDSIREIITDPLARFDPYDIPALNEALVRVLTDDAFVRRRRAAALSESARFNPSASASSAIDAYRFVASRGR